MPLGLQAKLLRVLEDGEVWGIGAKESRQVDVRILAATNVDLQQLIQQDAFRQDLYYRLARFTVVAPPLRERQEDIPLLARHFLRLFATEMGREPPPLGDEVLEHLRQYAFPGNVRELKNVIERALIESGDEEIRPEYLHFPSAATSAPDGRLELPLDLDRAIAEAELWVVKRALESSDGNVSAATRLLGTNRNRIYRILGQEKVPPANS